MKSVVMARVSYIGQGGLLSDEHLKKLDSDTLRHARQELQLLPGFSSVSLVHHQLIGYPTPSIVYREARLKCLWRGLWRGGQQAVAVQQHMNRTSPVRSHEQDSCSTKVDLTTINSRWLLTYTSFPHGSQ